MLNPTQGSGSKHVTVFSRDRRRNKGPKYSAAIASENQKILKVVPADS